MAWVVDTSVVLDLVTGDQVYEPQSTLCLQQHLMDGLVICPISLVEIAPSFGGDSVSAVSFLEVAGIDSDEPWMWQDTVEAHRLWNVFQTRRKMAGLARRPVADVLIASFATRFQGIITRNGNDFRNILPSLTLVVP